MGALNGLTVIEFAGLGPVPFAGMVLADQGARVIRIERPGAANNENNVLCRNRKRVALDLKHSDARDAVLRLIETADALIEPYRPGVMERLGLGPDDCQAHNPKLVYGRMTGWGQTGPLAAAAGHDINYIALSGVAHAIGRAGEAPVPPLNLVGDYGGGGMLLAFGVMAGVWEAQRSGRGQVIDAAMVDGASLLMAEYWGFLGRGEFSDRRGTHLLDGGAPFYQLYETSDHRHISVGPLEPKFYDELLQRLGLNPDEWQPQNDPTVWARLKTRLTDIFRSRTRAEWTAALEGTDSCFAPVLSLAEVPDHPHHLARKTVVRVNGMHQPSPAPRFARTPADKPLPGGLPGTHTREVLRGVGLTHDQISSLIAGRAAQQD
ncbi:MAG: CoA transferase [Hydrogenophaga sp.]|uniref:CaiB/BaiF CoA transferase family protein n=1 Tax=Hydrogenophaga sp. TaxID=1904254 RepID=UPI002621D185|nr:CaiB/BaiF CoA-transferase family protein [Hydrogenophaga sp.]MCW5668685.1 CoA transferase [Hydrogenophaga sp.]